MPGGSGEEKKMTKPNKTQTQKTLRQCGHVELGGLRHWAIIETTFDGRYTKSYRLIGNIPQGYIPLPGRGGRTTVNAAILAALRYDGFIDPDTPRAPSRVDL
jgi:hypothetical protein